MGTMHRGVAPHLEAEANRLIKESLKGVTKPSDKSDILTPWKETERHRREIFVASGTPDSSTRQGMFNRTINTARPELNSRDGLARARRDPSGSLGSFMDSMDGGWDQ